MYLGQFLCFRYSQLEEQHHGLVHYYSYVIKYKYIDVYFDTPETKWFLSRLLHMLTISELALFVGCLYKLANFLRRRFNHEN